MGKPVAVVQYNPWEAGGKVSTKNSAEDRVDNASNGSLIAVSYEVSATIHCPPPSAPQFTE
jgi:hypothetical protein